MWKHLESRTHAPFCGLGCAHFSLGGLGGGGGGGGGDAPEVDLECPVFCSWEQARMVSVVGSSQSNLWDPWSPRKECGVTDLELWVRDLLSGPALPSSSHRVLLGSSSGWGIGLPMENVASEPVGFKEPSKPTRP